MASISVKELQEGKEVYSDNISADNKQILETALQLDIIVEKGAHCGDIDEFTFSNAYLHVTNYCNYHCIGCYSYDSHRNKSQDLSTEEIVKTSWSISS